MRFSCEKGCTEGPNNDIHQTLLPYQNIAEHGRTCESYSLYKKDSDFRCREENTHYEQVRLIEEACMNEIIDEMTEEYEEKIIHIQAEVEELNSTVQK